MVTPKYIKERLIEHAEDKRAEARCELVKELYNKMKEENPEIWKEYDNIQKQKDTLNNEIDILDKKLRALRSDKNRIIDEYKLSKTEKHKRGTCSLQNMHPKLAKFDSDTEQMMFEILEADEISIDDVNAMVER